MRKGLKQISICAGSVALIGFASQSRATVAIDGTLDTDYGAALATQTVNTGFGDNTLSDGANANGSELDAAYGIVQGGALDLFLAGNLSNNDSNQNNNRILIFIADGRAGQSTLTTQGGSSNSEHLTGSKFSPGFAGTYMLSLNQYNGNWYLNSNDLTASNGPETYVGSVPAGAGNSATLNAGIKVSFNNANTAGVTGDPTGSAADSGAADAVTTGFEFSIPLSVLGSPHDPNVPIKVLADIDNNSDNYPSNQFLPGLPAPSQNLGAQGESNFDFSSTPGQYFSVAVPAPASINGIWIGTTGSWATATNWQSGNIPHSQADLATFGNVNPGTYTVHLDGSKTVGQLIFTAGSYTIDAGSGGTLTIDDTGDTSGGVPNITVQAGSHNIAVPLAFTANTNVVTTGTSSLSISGNISGGSASDATTGFLVKSGEGTLALSGSNTNTGGLSILQGTVELDSNTAATATQNIYIGVGNVDNQIASLNIGLSGLSISTPIQTVVEQTQVNINSRFITGTYTSGNSTLTGPITINGSVTFSAAAGGTLTASGVIADGSDTNASATHNVSVNGAGIIVLNNAETYSGETVVNSGTLNVPLGASIASSSPVFVNGGTFNMNGSFTGTTAPAVTVSGTLNFGVAPTRNLGPLNITGGTVTVAPATSHASRTVLTTAGLTFNGDSVNGWQGLLDLANNDMIVQVGANTDIGAITSQLKAGYANGTWNGTTGIRSSFAATDPQHLTTLGVLLNDNGDGAPIYPTFGPGAGQPSSVGDVLVKYTYVGDANLDGVVNGADYQQIDNGYSNQLGGWQNGDFNYDGTVDGSDYSLIDNAFNQLHATNASPLSIFGSALIAQPAVSAVPEPATFGLIALASTSLLGRRKRRNSAGM